MLKRIAVAFLVVLLGLAVLPFLLPRPGLDGQIPQQPFADSRFVQVSGVRLHLRERQGNDQRPLVVLLHGFAGSGWSWRHTLSALEQSGYAVVSVDLPPFGYSERSSGGGHWVDLVEGLLDQEWPQREIALVGHSMGATVAADLAARLPERSQSLVFVAGSPHARVAAGPSWLMRMPPLARAAEVYAAHSLITEQRLGEMLASAYGREPDSEELQGYMHPLTIPATTPALLRRLTQRGPSPEGWRRTPTTLIWGENDDWIPLQLGERLLELYPELTLEVIAEAGHNPMETHAEAFEALLLEALERTVTPL